jgi:hypothetical protein
MKDTLNPVVLFFAAFFVAVLLAVILAWPTQLLWNGCLVPAVDGVHEISLLQALGINVLFSILFKNSTSTKND